VGEATGLSATTDKRSLKQFEVGAMVTAATSAGTLCSLGMLVLAALSSCKSSDEDHSSKEAAAVASTQASNLTASLSPTASSAAPPKLAPTPAGQSSATLPAPTDSTCPADMVLARGSYCSRVEQDCEQWLDDQSLPYARCGRYRQPAKCVGTRRPLAVCIDRHEATEPGSTTPIGEQSLVRSQALCTKQGKRLCTESEWIFACEGEQMLPYPYGWERKAVCNYDQTDLEEERGKEVVLRDLRSPVGSHPGCASPFGVLDMVGNMDEPVLRDPPFIYAPWRTALKGGWWMPARNRCRPATTSHDDYYHGLQIGTRCCKEPK
jgi:sulfatase modifying factor 1